MKERYQNGANEVQVRAHDHHKEQLKDRATKAFALWDSITKDGKVDKCELAIYYHSQNVPWERCVVQAKN